ncbi:MAG: hypothetical protein P4L99_02150 [Chthoniobacter sp.]|nr:hypothetical protein [Chthoniobacter sp.]
MSHKPSTFWAFALPVSLVILAAAYYIKIPSARAFIDAHTSLGHQLFGSFVHDTVVVETKPAKADDPLASMLTDKGSTAEAKPATPTPIPVFDLQKLARDPAHWPKKVALKKPTVFPAVVNGKPVGSLVAPVGAEANLKTIKDGKVGLEYQGGGAWLAVEDTDLAVRAMAQ